MKKKLLSLCLVLALAAIAIVGGTLAYFTDTDEATNTFTMGNVSIELLEANLHRENPSGLSNPDYALDTAQSDEAIETLAQNYQGWLAEAGQNLVPGNSFLKCPYVRNTGSNDAYVRVNVLIPTEWFAVLMGGKAPDCSMFNETAFTRDVAPGGTVTSSAQSMVSEWASGGADAIAKYIVNYNGNSYYRFDFTYQEALKPGEMTYWNAWNKVAIDPLATAEDLPDTIPQVVITAEAIQAEGFADAAAAFAAFDSAA